MPNHIINRTQENRVTIKIWKPTHIGAGKTGHVSLQTYSGGLCGKGIYVSFYPMQTVNFFRPSSYPVQHTLEQDLLKGRPDVTINLYSLNVDRINQAYQEFVDSGHNWNFFASSKLPFIKNEENAKNCVALVAHLLGIGGIENLFVEVPQPESMGKYILIGSLIGLGIGVAVALIILTAGAATPVVGLGALALKATIATGLGTVGVSTAVAVGGIGMVAGAAIGTTAGSLGSGGATGFVIDLNNAIVGPNDIIRLVQEAKLRESKYYFENQNYQVIESSNCCTIL